MNLSGFRFGAPPPSSDGRTNSPHLSPRFRAKARVAILLSAVMAFASLFALGSMVRADVTYQYNSDGELTQVKNGSGQCVTYGYDSDGNITAVTDCVYPTATATP